LFLVSKRRKRQFWRCILVPCAVATEAFSSFIFNRMVALDDIKKFLRAYQRKTLDDPTLIRSAVLMPLVEKKEGLSFLLTKRTMLVEHHKGQIAFPGGARDHTDYDLIATALREAEEEIALPPSSVEVFGCIDDFRTPSGFSITPVVGYIAALPALVPSVREVEAIFTVPVSIFLDPKSERIEHREHNGTVHTVYFYRHESYEVWGATAAIIRSFLHAVGAHSLEDQ
jgi:8-oxo-dGTP pyrophosphatase MutT (NUDIX family)